MTQSRIHPSRRFVALFAILSLVLAIPGFVRAGSVIGSRHDLSTADQYSNEPCVFCHTPHFANTSVAAPLWNRVIDTTKTFSLYDSPTMDTSPVQPAGSISEVCLGCHDGTISHAVQYTNPTGGPPPNITLSDKHEIINAPGSGNIPDRVTWPNCERCHVDMYGGERVLNIGPALSNDHPISMLYPTAAEDPEFSIPPSLSDGWSDIRLFSGRVECASCHDVHDPDLDPFLAAPNSVSQLCLTCHTK